MVGAIFGMCWKECGRILIQIFGVVEKHVSLSISHTFDTFGLLDYMSGFLMNHRVVMSVVLICSGVET